jgi:hypothetical protein
LQGKDVTVAESGEQPTEESPADDIAVAGAFEKTAEGTLRWPATADRDSPQLGNFSGSYDPAVPIGTLLQMEGRQGRIDADVKAVTGVDLNRSRRWHKIFERMGIIYPGKGNTRLGRLGRLLRDAAQPNGMKLVVAREAIEVLRRYQFDNPVERALPEGCSIHPYYAVLRTASKLGWMIHWDEMNRELMRLMKDADLDAAIDKIRIARADPSYEAFIGGASNDAGPLSARAHAAVSAPAGRTPEGQLRDQQMTPFLKRAGFGELLLESPGTGGGGYWTVPPDVREIVSASVATPPVAKLCTTEQEWIEWFCEGTSVAADAMPPPPPPAVTLPIASMTLATLKSAISTYEPELTFSDPLLASLVAALRSGEGKTFVILRGVSGTGKSRLAAAVAKAIYGSTKVDRPHLTIVEIRPDWTDGSPILGHYDPIGGRYIREPVLDALIAANNSPDAPVFVCLDEMNLARVEYYLAECLSAMESGNEITLDTRGDINVPARLAWPKNLFLFGTVNVDESTLKISDKVLDRAQVIDTSDIDLLPPLKAWVDAAGTLDETEKKKVIDVLGGVWSILKSVDAHFGYRAARAVVRFTAEAKASSDGAVNVDTALDVQLCQKILVKLRGEGERWTVPLEQLEKLCTGLGTQENSRAIIIRMRQDLERLGSFQFWN